MLQALEGGVWPPKVVAATHLVAFQLLLPQNNCLMPGMSVHAVDRVSWSPDEAFPILHPLAQPVLVVYVLPVRQLRKDLPGDGAAKIVDTETSREFFL